MNVITANEYNGPIFLPPSEAAKVLGLGRSTLTRWCSQGLIPYTKSGVAYKINMPMLLAMLDAESRRNCPAAAAMDAPHLEPLQ